MNLSNVKKKLMEKKGEMISRMAFERSCCATPTFVNNKLNRPILYAQQSMIPVKSSLKNPILTGSEYFIRRNNFDGVYGCRTLTCNHHTENFASLAFPIFASFCIALVVFFFNIL